MKRAYFPAASDMQAMVRMVNELYSTPRDPEIRRRLLLERLCQILHMRKGISLFKSPQKSARRAVTYVDSNCDFQKNGGEVPDELKEEAIEQISGMTRQDGGTVSLCQPNRSTRGARYSCILSAISADNQETVAVLCFWPINPSENMERARQIIHLVHGEMLWIYRDDLPAINGKAPKLTPRQRSSLHCLLAGNSEKQIASRLGLSPHTVHVHVKAIYKQLHVSSRGELLSRFVPRYGIDMES